ncbi:hypothetical protein Tco_1202674 [Tanacetum coccineum]
MIVLVTSHGSSIIFNDDDIEERTSRWVNKCVKKFNPYARYGVEHWKNPHAKIFYIRKQKEPGKSKEEIYSNSKIGSSHQPDYKNLNKNDIEDIYLLIMNGKVPDYADTGLIWSLSGRQTQGYANNRARNAATTQMVNQEANKNGAAVQQRAVKYDLDAFDSDCDDVPSAKEVLMANLSSYDSDVLSEETKTLVVQSTSSSTQQDEHLVSVIEEMSSQVAKCNKEFKQKEDKYLDEVIDLKKKIKALDNVVYKMGQSTQTMHMLIKPQVFYDESHKIALGYQNPLYLSQARWKVHALYDGNTIVKTHVALSVTDNEETIELAEERRLKVLAKQNDPSLKEHKVNLKLIDYVALNKLFEHFVKHFVPQKQLSAEQAYWLPISQPVVVKPLVPSEPALK